METSKNYIISRKKDSEIQYLTENKKWDVDRNKAMVFDTLYKANSARIKSFIECIREGYPANAVIVESI